LQITITKKFPEIKVLILSSTEDNVVISEVMAVGASGYLLKSAVGKDVALAVKSVYSGSYYFAPGIMDNLVDAAREHFHSQNPKSFESVIKPELEKIHSAQSQKGSNIVKVNQQEQVKKCSPKSHLNLKRVLILSRLTNKNKPIFLDQKMLELLMLQAK